jgi:hypothetical protein
MPLAAQFEGTVKMKMSTGDNGQSADVTYMMKGRKIVYLMQSAMAQGVDIRMIIDRDAQKSTMLMPMTGAMASMAQVPGMANAKGLMMVTDLSKAAASTGSASATAPTFKDLGTSETIAGYKCEDFEMTSGKNVMRMCMAKELGTFAFAGAGSMGGRRGGGGGGGAPAWAQSMGNMGFPLKVWSPDGKIAQEVTSIDRNPVPESAFAIPDGYVDMSSMLGGRRGGGGGGN